MPYKENTGKWRATPKYQNKRLKTKLFSTKKEAILYEIKQKDLERQKEQNSQSGPDLLSFCSRYQLFAERKYVAKVVNEKKAVCDRILEAWGPDTQVDSITPEMVYEYLNEQADKRSNNASNKDRKNLLAMFNKAKKIHGLNFNPVTDIDKLPHDLEPQYTPPTEDVLKLLAAADRKELVFLHCYIFTGARRSEIFRWIWTQDVNFDQRTYRLGTRKTKDGTMSYEWFPMPDELYDQLWWWWNNRTIKTSPYVFTDDQPGPHYGKPYKERRRFMAGLCKRAGVKPFGFHAVRRFFASRLSDMGKSTPTIQRMLRHKNVTTTERYIKQINKDMAGITEGLLDIEEKKVHMKGTQNKERANGDDR